jgi:hypothetical protein
LNILQTKYDDSILRIPFGNYCFAKNIFSYNLNNIIPTVESITYYNKSKIKINIDDIELSGGEFLGKVLL